MRDRGGVGFHADVMAADGVVVEEGDIGCLRTGFGEKALEMNGNPDLPAARRADEGWQHR
jgi:hypothetical protein